MAKFCSNCGTEIKENENFCSKCGNNTNQAETSTENTQNTESTQPQQGKSKIAAGLLGVFLGGFGIHNFYLGYTSKGVAQILVTIVTCGIGSLWGFIEGIMILAGSINTDADGNPLIQ